jgi:hypothetical protein
MILGIDMNRAQRKQYFINELNYEIEKNVLLFQDGVKVMEWRGAKNDVVWIIQMLREEKKNLELENFHLLPIKYKNALNTKK